ncbi:hypothetical protein WN51_14222 [Melipona quadrifasciata]|uniref:Uncharacterized protein n=1 Tax=Melipona quadrifasciata TaxID=166423 RepID=A0A0N0BG16_9HYME|nr:hypothetical protein WN51_14222 [Melipona quadrifasciata]
MEVKLDNDSERYTRRTTGNPATNYFVLVYWQSTERQREPRLHPGLTLELPNRSK